MSPEKRSMPPIPKPDAATKAFFRSVVPDHPAVGVRPMFGNLAAFVNGNMFMGLFGPDLFLRLSDDDQALVQKAGGGSFEPMPGRAMSGYVVVPEGLARAAQEAGHMGGTLTRVGHGAPPEGAEGQEEAIGRKGPCPGTIP